MNTNGIAEALLLCALTLIIFKLYGNPFARIRAYLKKSGRSMDAWWYAKRDKEQRDRYAKFIHDKLFEEWCRDEIDQTEYNKWMKRFGADLPGLVPVPLEPVKVKIRRRLNTPDQYVNRDQIHRKYFPEFTANALNYRTEFVVLRFPKAKKLFPVFKSSWR
jgi:hypothetical protein